MVRLLEITKLVPHQTKIKFIITTNIKISKHKNKISHELNVKETSNKIIKNMRFSNNLIY